MVDISNLPKSTQVAALMHTGSYEKAEELLNDILSDKNMPFRLVIIYKHELAMVLAHRENFEGARKLLKRLHKRIVLTKDMEDLHYSFHIMGRVEAMAGKWQIAKEYFENERKVLDEIREIEYADGENANQLGFVYMKLGYFDSAKKQFEKAVVYAEEYDDNESIGYAHLGLGDWYMQMRNEAKAQEMWVVARKYLSSDRKSVVKDLELRVGSIT